jgi:ribosomal protein S18 acetylase RimI-like enzyme
VNDSAQRIVILRTAPHPEELIAIERRALALFTTVGYDPRDWPVSDTAEIRAAEHAGLLWVARRDGETAGFARASAHGQDLHLEELDVDPTHGRAGVGSALLCAILGEAAARRCEAVTLRTFRTTPWSIGLYERFGFRTVPAADVPGYLARMIAQERFSPLPIADRITMAKWHPEAAAP